MLTGYPDRDDIAHDPALQDRAFGHVGPGAIFTLIVGIHAVAGEYRHDTVTATYLSFPPRRRVVTAKPATYGLADTAAGLVSPLLAIVTTAAWCATMGGAFYLTTADTWRTLGGAWAANLAFAAIGVGVGTLAQTSVPR